MEDFKEYAEPYLKTLREPKSRKLFKIVQKIQNEAGIMDLEDFENVLELLQINNSLEKKKSIWGHSYLCHLSAEQNSDFLMLKYINSELMGLDKKDQLEDAHREAEQNFKRSFDPNTRK